MTSISDFLKEKFALQPTEFQIGHSSLQNASIYEIPGISEKYRVLMANCDQHGITHENEKLYVFVNGIANQIEFTTELLESNDGKEVLLKEVNQLIEKIEAS